MPTRETKLKLLEEPSRIHPYYYGMISFYAAGFASSWLARHDEAFFRSLGYVPSFTFMVVGTILACSEYFSGVRYLDGILRHLGAILVPVFVTLAFAAQFIPH